MRSPPSGGWWCWRRRSPGRRWVEAAGVALQPRAGARPSLARAAARREDHRRRAGRRAGGVEMAKRRLGERRSTGDLFVVPAASGIAVGRVGCFLTGLDDHTYGLPTTLPWGGGLRRRRAAAPDAALRDRVPRRCWRRRWLWRGAAAAPARATCSRLFMVGYLGFRLLLELHQAGARPVLGLNAIQWVCLAGLACTAPHLPPPARPAPAGASPSPEATRCPRG